MGSIASVKPSGATVCCPYFAPAAANRTYRAGGLCTGLPRGAPMIPTVEERRRWCGGAHYTACPIYRSRHGGEEIEAWLRSQEGAWALGEPVGAAG
jgi:hypothetical protein